MALETISYHVDNGVAHLTLNRPDKSNAINLRLARELMLATMAMSEDKAVRAVLLTGAGKNFCVGGDLTSGPDPAHNELQQSFDVSGLRLHVREVATYLHAAVIGMARLGKPVVTAVQGWAAGAGISLACGSDLLLLGESARLVSAYTRVGLSPDGGGSWYLPRLVGLQRAMDLVLTNRTLSASEALDWGVASRVLPDADLHDEAANLAYQLAEMAPGSMAATKALLRDSDQHPLDAQLELELLALVDNASGDGRRLVGDFLNKREAVAVGGDHDTDAARAETPPAT